MKALRILVKIFLFPLSLMLTIIVTVSMFIVERFAVMLNILSGIIFIAALAGYAQYLSGWPVGAAGERIALQLAIFATVFAFILSPYGLPALAMWLLGKLGSLNDLMKAI
jgi:hypothetical protein